MSASQWIADRLPTSGLHLDAASCGRISRAALAAEIAHLEAEPFRGGQVAESESAAAIDTGRAALGAMVGLSAADVFFGEGAGSVFATLLDAWPLPRGARIGTARSEYGGNARVLRERAATRGWTLVELDADELGRVGDVPAGLDLVTLPQIASQRGISQPVEDLLASGVPLLLDVAQSLGQSDVPAGAAAYVGTSRKWLCGPRGVGFAVVDPAWHGELALPATLQAVSTEGLLRWESAEGHVAGRVGLALAVRTWSPEVVPVGQAAAAALRVLIDGVAGWRVVEPVTEPTGITTLVHDLASPFATRAALQQDGILTSAVPSSRAEELDRPVLRLSTAAWVTPGDLERVVEALATCTQ